MLPHRLCLIFAPVRPLLLTAGLVAAAAGGVAAVHGNASTPETRPIPQEAAQNGGLPVLQVTNRAALKEHIGKEVIVVGNVAEARWSRSGKVMNVVFADVDEKDFGIALFDRQRERFDEAFGGDVAKTLTGQQVRIKGKLTEYGGRSSRYEGRPEIILSEPSQITIVAPTTRESDTEGDEQDPR
jgi:DNA/RNA endonuclease YhcR with UshA esterase domain